MTELTPAGAKGTFSFTTGPNNSATPAVRTVTEGTFDVSFQGRGGVAAPGVAADPRSPKVP